MLISVFLFLSFHNCLWCISYICLYINTKNILVTCTLVAHPMVIFLFLFSIVHSHLWCILHIYLYMNTKNLLVKCTLVAPPWNGDSFTIVKFCFFPHKNKFLYRVDTYCQRAFGDFTKTVMIKLLFYHSFFVSKKKVQIEQQKSTNRTPGSMFFCQKRRMPCGAHPKFP